MKFTQFMMMAILDQHQNPRIEFDCHHVDMALHSLGKLSPTADNLLSLLQLARPRDGNLKAMNEGTDNHIAINPCWHPRVTPFRLMFVISTTTIGIAKAILVSKGNAIGSTTAEWIGGVILALR